MDDLSICKRIAEIEGIEGNIYEAVRLSGQRSNNAGTGVITSPQSFIDIYNPLTDDALCFQLMIKHDVDLVSPYRGNDETQWEAQIFSKDYADVTFFYDVSPNKAICMAIIEAHKDNNNESNR